MQDARELCDLATKLIKDASLKVINEKEEDKP
jgi:hypothetical protein